MFDRYLILSGLLLSATTACCIDAAISYAAFQSPEQAYVELYIRINGGSISFRTEADSLLQARAVIDLQFLRDGEEVLRDRFQVSSPATSKAVDFIALERYPLPPGAYQLRLELSDAVEPENHRRYRAAFELHFHRDTLAQSDINLLATLRPSEHSGPLVRNGFHMEPLPNHYYGPDTDRLFFYHEIYNSDTVIRHDFVLTYAIEVLQNGTGKRVLERHKRQSPDRIISLYGQLDIGDIPSGFYQLAIELRTPEKELLSRKTTFFQRSNPNLWKREDWLTSFDPATTFVGRLSEDSLNYSLRALNPVLPPTDMESVDWLLKQQDLRAKQAFLLNYWTTRSGDYAAGEYQQYMQIVRAIDQQFHSGFRYGFETDRGYIYLKYGRPTEIEARENESSAPPYEIWTYDHLPATRQNNVRFIFYNPSLAPGDYVLLHSTARGELQQPQWQRMLYKNAPNEQEGDDFLEGTEVIDNFHRSSRRIFGEGG